VCFPIVGLGAPNFSPKHFGVLARLFIFYLVGKIFFLKNSRGGQKTETRSIPQNPKNKI
jgi:hypothetical protein